MGHATYYRHGDGRSLNARDAEANDRMPLTRATAAVRAEMAARGRKITVAQAREALRATWGGEWHHVGKYAAECAYYEVAEAVRHLRLADPRTAARYATLASRHAERAASDRALRAVRTPREARLKILRLAVAILRADRANASQRAQRAAMLAANRATYRARVRAAADGGLDGLLTASRYPGRAGSDEFLAVRAEFFLAKAARDSGRLSRDGYQAVIDRLRAVARAL